MKLIVPALGEHDQFVDPAKELACVGDDLNGPGLAAECMRSLVVEPYAFPRRRTLSVLLKTPGEIRKMQQLRDAIQ